ncbi:acyltransferase family protein [Kluyvera georgiana]|uniref:acyltransferase family protein n=1 Tax=Kluyvera georgiana TaxID=73098 RepID=UPI003D967C3F
MSRIKFRTDINGLRCYAVLLVVLFHFGIQGFGSGFIGVDVFFVVSGYLMSAMIIPGVLNKDFRLFDFYIARAVRIIPSIILLVIVFYAISFQFAPPDMFKDFSKYAIKSLLFTSNIEYLKLANGYFTGDSHSNFLLHTWSLSVEWQFYLVYPLIIMLTGKLTRSLKAISVVLSLILVISLFSSIFYATIDSSFNFYMLPTRAWEMTIGGIVFITSQKNIDRLPLFRIAVILLLISACVNYDIKLWPGYAAILPVVATALILFSCNKNSILLNNKVAQLIGSASYSIYLWHWPLFVTLSYFELLADTKCRLLSAFASIVVGILVYMLFEKRASKWLKKRNKKQIVASILIPALLCISVFDYTRSHSGFLWRGGDKYQKVSAEIVLPSPSNGWCFYAIASDKKLKLGENGVTCHVGNTDSKKNAVLFGDSFAGHYIPFWDSVGKQVGLNINPITTNWCSPSVGREFMGPKTSIAYKQCMFNREYFAKNFEKYDYLIFSGAWSYIVSNAESLRNVEALIKMAQGTGKRIIIMDEPYQFEANIGELYKKSIWDRRQFDITKYLVNGKNAKQKEVDTILTALTAGNKNTIFLSRSMLFSETQTNGSGVPYSLDGEHISVIGSLSAAEYFIKGNNFHRLVNFLQ